MGLFDALLGRTKPVPADLDALFALPTAAITLEAAAGLRPTGTGSVCVKAAEGGDFLRAYADAQALLRLDETAEVTEFRDSFGYAWLTSMTTPVSARPCCVLRSGSPAPWTAYRVGWRWSTSTSAARSTRSPRSDRSVGTPRSSCNCGPAWKATSRSSRTCNAGSRSGTPPGSDPPLART